MRKSSVVLLISILSTIFTAGSIAAALVSNADQHQASLIEPIIIEKKSSLAQKPTQPTPTTKTTSSTGSAVLAKNSNIESCGPPQQQTQAVVPQNETEGLHISSTKIGYYTVYGNTKSELISQLYYCTPVPIHQGHYAASTEYVVNWSVNYSALDDGRCAVDSPRVNMGIAQTYPRWVNTQPAIQTMQTIWDTFMSHVTEHENGHVDIDKDYAWRLFRMLSDEPPAECLALQTSVGTKAQQIINSLDQANNDYDAKTQHGTTQGAVL